MSRPIIHPPGYLHTHQYNQDLLRKRGLIACPMWVSPSEHNTIALLANNAGVTMVEYVTKLFTEGLSKL